MSQWGTVKAPRERSDEERSRGFLCSVILHPYDDSGTLHHVAQPKDPEAKTM